MQFQFLRRKIMKSFTDSFKEELKKDYSYKKGQADNAKVLFTMLKNAKDFLTLRDATLKYFELEKKVLSEDTILAAKLGDKTHKKDPSEYVLGFEDGKLFWDIRKSKLAKFEPAFKKEQAQKMSEFAELIKTANKEELDTLRAEIFKEPYFNNKEARAPLYEAVAERKEDLSA